MAKPSRKAINGGKGAFASAAAADAAYAGQAADRGAGRTDDGRCYPTILRLEATMVMQTNDPKRPEPARNKDDGKLERLARTIDPPGKEIDDQALKDPGRATPGARPVDNRT